MGQPSFNNSLHLAVLALVVFGLSNFDKPARTCPMDTPVQHCHRTLDIGCSTPPKSTDFLDTHPRIRGPQYLGLPSRATQNPWARDKNRTLKAGKKLVTLLDLCVSSLRRGHANLLCIVPILTDDPRRESDETLIHLCRAQAVTQIFCMRCFDLGC